MSQKEYLISKMTNIITGYKFAEISNVVFSGIFLESQIDSLDLNENVEDYIKQNLGRAYE